MRKGMMLPSWGMVGAFILGMGIMLIWGLSGAIYGADAVSEFFSAFSILIQYPVIGIIFVIVMIVAIIKFWYFVGPFFMGVLFGLFILMFLGSSLYSGLGWSLPFGVTSHNWGLIFMPRSWARPQSLTSWGNAV